MNRASNPHDGASSEQRLFELACQIEDQLSSGIGNQDVSDSVDHLTAEDLDELRRAEQALAFLHRVRKRRPPSLSAAS